MKVTDIKTFVVIKIYADEYRSNIYVGQDYDTATEHAKRLRSENIDCEIEVWIDGEYAEDVQISSLV